jgi:hypothetical protein
MPCRPAQVLWGRQLLGDIELRPGGPEHLILSDLPEADFLGVDLKHGGACGAVANTKPHLGCLSVGRVVGSRRRLLGWKSCGTMHESVFNGCDANSPQRGGWTARHEEVSP